MATHTKYYFSYIGYLILFGFLSYAEAVTAQPAKKPAAASPSIKPIDPAKRPFSFTSEAQLRQAVYDTAATFIGKKEGKAQNSGAWIAAINKFNHLPKNAHYCASAYYYVHAMNGVRLPVAGVGMVRSYFSQAKNIIYRRNVRGNQRTGRKPALMDAVSLFYSHIEGIAQNQFDPLEDDFVKTIGFNTSGGPGTPDGCYVNFRRTREIKAIANWISPYWLANAPKL